MKTVKNYKYAFENNNGTANLGAKKLVCSQNRRLLFSKAPTYMSLQVNTAWPDDSVTTRNMCLSNMQFPT